MFAATDVPWSVNIFGDSMTRAMSYELPTLRIRACHFFAGLLWLHVPVVIAIALSNHAAPLRLSLIMALAAAVGTIAAQRCPGSLTARLIIAAALTVGPALIGLCRHGRMANRLAHVFLRRFRNARGFC